jgi:hypothetical protein
MHAGGWVRLTEEAGAEEGREEPLGSHSGSLDGASISSFLSPCPTIKFAPPTSITISLKGYHVASRLSIAKDTRGILVPCDSFHDTKVFWSHSPQQNH